MSDLMVNIEEFYDFMAKRERVRRCRLEGLPRDQWTDDTILQTYRFTNVKRHHDRTTIGLKALYDQSPVGQALVSWKYGDPPGLLPPKNFGDHMRQLMLNCTLYRFFGTVGMAKAIGWVPSWSEEQKDRIVKLADDRSLLGMEVFTSAYIVSAGGISVPKSEVVCEVARQLWHAMGADLENPDLSEVSPLYKMTRWEVACYRLCKLWCFGPFMAKEVLLDFILVSGWIPDDWTTWTPVGPGGRRGAARVWYGSLQKMSDDEALSVIQTIYGWREKFWAFQDDMPLDLTDIQFQLCEFDKWSRVSEGRRPKRKFSPTIDEVTDETQRS